MSRGQTVVCSYDLKGVHDMQPFALDLPAPALFNNLINKLLLVINSSVGKRKNLISVSYRTGANKSLTPNTELVRTSTKLVSLLRSYKQYYLYLWVALYSSMCLSLSNSPAGRSNSMTIPQKEYFVSPIDKTCKAREQ